jgi:DNA polymerase III subunit delta'
MSAHRRIGRRRKKPVASRSRPRGTGSRAAARAASTAPRDRAVEGDHALEVLFGCDPVDQHLQAHEDERGSEPVGAADHRDDERGFGLLVGDEPHGEADHRVPALGEQPRHQHRCHPGTCRNALAFSCRGRATLQPPASRSDPVGPEMYRQASGAPGVPSLRRMWERVVGQERAVGLLQRAAERPVHAYLLVGPRGSGLEDAARCFAAEIVAPDDDQRVQDLVVRGMHPDVVEFEPEGNQILVAQAEAIIREAHSAPIEAERKVVAVLEADRLNEQASNKLLKTIEEPPARSTIVLVTSSPDELLETVRSRCQRIDLATLPEAALRDALVREGADPRSAELAARLAGGRLDRGRGMLGELGEVRRAFVTVAAQLDGTGGSAMRGVDRLTEALQDAVARLDGQHAVEYEELTAELERAGYPDRSRTALLKRQAARQRRQHRRARTDLLLEGITALESVYRDVLAGPDAPRLNTDQPVLELSPRSCVEAIGTCRQARDAFEFNPNESLLLERLLLRLPAATAA